MSRTVQHLAYVKPSKEVFDMMCAMLWCSHVYLRYHGEEPDEACQILVDWCGKLAGKVQEPYRHL